MEQLLNESPAVFAITISLYKEASFICGTSLAWRCLKVDQTDIKQHIDWIKKQPSLIAAVK